MSELCDDFEIPVQRKVNLCIDCKHHAEPVKPYEFTDTCRRLISINPVNGKVMAGLCGNERAPLGRCMGEGKYWEPKDE